jgi:hypothetical protein
MENYYKPKPNFSFAELKEILVIGVAGYTDLKQLAFLNQIHYLSRKISW